MGRPGGGGKRLVGVEATILVYLFFGRDSRCFCEFFSVFRPGGCFSAEERERGVAFSGGLWGALFVGEALKSGSKDLW